MNECKELTSGQFLNALDSVTWYNGLAEIVFSWRDLKPAIPTHGTLITPPQNYGADNDVDKHQLQVLWMIAVELFGDCGTSPRSGWIEKVYDFKQWCLDITETWRGSEEYTGPDEYKVIYESV